MGDWGNMGLHELGKRSAQRAHLHFGSASFTIEPSASWFAFENDPNPAQTFTSFIVEWSVEDCDENGVNDACESDLDADGTIDACDDDIDGDGIPMNVMLTRKVALTQAVQWTASR